MANWKIIISLHALWSRQDELTPQAFTAELVTKLKTVLPAAKKVLEEDADSKLQEIIDDFQMSIDEESTYDDVDYCLEQLYDWADWNFVWLDTLNGPDASHPLRVLRSVVAAAKRDGNPVIVGRSS